MFKINDYITTLDNRLGSPINSFWYTAKYSMMAVESLGSADWSRWNKFKFRVRFYWTLMFLKFGNIFLSFFIKDGGREVVDIVEADKKVDVDENGILVIKA